MQQVRSRHDPAPSRLRYRLHRLMLTPLFRRFLRVGIPFCLSFGLGVAYLSEPRNREALILTFAELRHQFETRPEFMVRLLAVEGASDGVAGTVRELFPYPLPVSSFDLDPDAVRGLVEDLPAVAAASVRIRQGGVLELDIEERQPAALWQRENGLAVIDRQGVIIGKVDSRDEKPALPLVSGEGAGEAIAEALALNRAAAPLGSRLQGLVRVGERRWNVVLDRDQRILLPEKQPARALDRVIALSEAQDLMARDIAAVDMRLSERPTVRMNGNAVEHWWRVRRLVAEKEGR
ncbi:cell division protein FtsQ/DivIB [Roseovarius sp. TE539]|uniref:cell division protein FtsQ/DivIB n=1 Tax=Roseovarius sp. TE539 TaxID=2249812 RepID=UPI00215C1C8C|nr:cell division protein FtsQ/DivIB [Roseovarius sp. TE539]